MFWTPNVRTSLQGECAGIVLSGRVICICIHINVCISLCICVYAHWRLACNISIHGYLLMALQVTDPFIGALTPFQSGPKARSGRGAGVLRRGAYRRGGGVVVPAGLGRAAVTWDCFLLRAPSMGLSFFKGISEAGPLFCRWFRRVLEWVYLGPILGEH